MGNSPVMTRAHSTLFFLLGLLMVGQFSYAAEKKRETINLYEVPTSGKIIDVEYRPEFDEWWVKCREGETIAVYSYDKRGNRWGKIVFAPKKTEDRTKPGEKTKATPGTDTEPLTQEEKAGPRSKDQEPKQDGKSDKTRWWDPLNIIKGGERLILPPPSDRGK